MPEADTVFEIGGQDSKYISLQGGEVADFQMNKICAAGTGSFVEEQAARMGIPIGDFGPLALRGEHPLRPWRSLHRFYRDGHRAGRGRRIRICC